MAFFHLDGNSNQETKFERVKFSENGYGCSNILETSQHYVKINALVIR
jgi:hypothetical protein